MARIQVRRILRLSGRFLLAVWLLSIGLLAACSSERENVVGVGLPGTEFAGLLDTLRVDALDAFGNLPVEPEPPYTENQVLYFGNRGDESSAILARYDFVSAFEDSVWDDVNFETDVDSLYLRLFMLTYYQGLLPPTAAKGLIKGYAVKELSEPLDGALYDSLQNRVPLPPTVFGVLNFGGQVGLQASGSIITIPLNKTNFTRWQAAGDHNGIMVEEPEDSGSDAGFIGFAAVEMKRAASTLDPELVGTLLGPILNVQFSNPDTLIRLVPTVDLSTLHRLDAIDPSADEAIVLRTHLRSYPYLSFSLADLPPNVFINSAILRVTNDTLSSYGPLMTIVTAEIDSSFAAAGDDGVTLSELKKAVTQIGGRRSLDPTLETTIQFNVTRAIQRHINGIFDEPFRILLIAAEDFFPDFDTSTIDPDFYLDRFRFFGTGADPTLRPYLRITYTSLDDLSGGGQ